MSEFPSIVVDGTVLAMARSNPQARTGIFFVIRDLCLALSRTDTPLYIATQFREMGQALNQTLAELDLRRHALTTQVKIGHDPVAFLSPFHAAANSMYGLPRVRVFQAVYDLSFHACPELGGSGLDFERHVARSITGDGIALCTSENTQSDLIRYFSFPRERSAVFYPGIRPGLGEVPPVDQLSSASLRDFLRLPAAGIYVLCLSTLEPRKNLATTLKAFAHVFDLAPESDLFLVITGVSGWGGQEKLLEDLPQRVRDRIRVTGYVADEILPPLLSEALCLIYPSLYEGFGFPPLEAMACGTPAIVSDAGSLPEVTAGAARVVERLDFEAIAQTIVAWGSDEPLRQRWIGLGLEHARKFTWQKAAETIRMVIAEHPPRE